eukprot:CAMPEP_0201523002 /NCGR_PEP_ID=MMETSP0161_2-20130828/18687_1 /ASSEMBLY_ACC=CAM_ASM_000251 /TAXON_ID=180227 /ORGANISM="Neoparamoeba aestuarina, Strain SoJaBio B1-5/56/2" /LENGTH=95 /DNA_ID=CAMNT_0047921991 /DNA_START=565 /DNA_END=856 /DNA_ORIENTATION=+
MACAAIAATGKGGLGFDGTVGCLVADKSLTAHVITIDAKGKPKEDGSPPFSVFTTRYNPAQPGAEQGQQHTVPSQVLWRELKIKDVALISVDSHK